MKLNFNLNTIPARLKRNKLIVFWIALGVLLLAEAWVLKGSVGILLNAKAPTQVVTNNSQIVHINFDQYNGVIKKLDDAKNYQPQAVEVKNPFGLGKAQ